MGERIPPALWAAHRQDYKFLGPSCLCAAGDPDQDYTEVTIFKIVDTPASLRGKYVAACAGATCKYFG